MEWKELVEMAQKNELLNKQGYCPYCKKNNLEYVEVQFEGEDLYFPWRCKDCGLEGQEWYHLSFEGHNIETEEGTISL